MNLTAAQEALQACIEGIAAIKSIQKSNEALLSNFNDNIYPAWYARKTANLVKMGNWEQKRGEYDKYKGFDDNFPFNSSVTNWTLDCWGCSSGACWYPGTHNWSNEICVQDAKNKQYLHPDDYYYTGEHWHDGDNDCTKKNKARWKCAKRQNRITDWRSEYNNIKPTFSEVEPRAPEQNQTKIEIACCANEINVVGSDMIESIITQENGCESSLRNKVRDAENKEAAAVKAEAAAVKAEADAVKKKYDDDIAKALTYKQEADNIVAASKANEETQAAAVRAIAIKQSTDNANSTKAISEIQSSLAKAIAKKAIAEQQEADYLIDKKIYKEKEAIILSVEKDRKTKIMMIGLILLCLIITSSIILIFFNLYI
jgi:hypothetical protein